MELGGTPWTANNPLLVGKPHLAFRERPPSNRINVRDLHACLYAHDRIPIYRVRKLFRGIAEAVEYLHNTVGVFHGDLKLQNILVDADFNVKLVDMSAARKISGGPLDRFFGTPMYGSPEATRGGIFDGCKNDIWSLGIILFMLLTCSDREPVFVNQVPKVPRSIQPDAASVVRSCLSHHPSHRPTIHSLRTHPFIQVPQMQQHAAFPAAMTMTTAVTTRRAAHPASTLSSPGSMMLVARP